MRHHEYIQLNKFSELRVLENQESRRKYQYFVFFVDPHQIHCIYKTHSGSDALSS